MFTPPTDSLYKFLAIFGLVMLGWGAWFPLGKYYEYKLKEVDLKLAAQKAALKAEQLDKEYSQLTEEEKRYEGRADPANGLQLANIRGRKIELHLKLIEAQLPANQQQAVVTVLENAYGTYRLIGFASICSGVVLTLIGFGLWYTRIQRHLDTDLSNGPPSASVDPVRGEDATRNSTDF